MASSPFLERPVGIAQGREGKEKFTAKQTSTLTFQQVMQVVRCIFSTAVAHGGNPQDRAASPL
ncbi:MAG: hypothetical protein V7L29_12475 [Nostoc sp.]|uniref:hypothetical protein n=1 Tax=Nostoc sp. TaxID=1180 RepID=UPI002FF81204